MIRQDYIMAMIEQFFNAIAKFLRIKDSTPELIVPSIERLYSDYLDHERDYYLHTDINHIISSFPSNTDKANTAAEVLAELYYQEFNITTDSLHKQIFAKNLLQLYHYIDIRTKLYSMERQQRKNDMENYLKS